MNSEFIPEIIKQNINFDWNNLERVQELNNMFRDINENGEEIKLTDDYNKLIVEINNRINEEHNVKNATINDVDVVYNSKFNFKFNAYPLSFMETENKQRIDEGDKIIMPASCLDILARLNISYPMLFELTNTANGRKTHCGVLEFVAPEGNIFLPDWMMQNLYLEPDNVVQIRSVNMKKGTHVIFRPHTVEFIELQNPKVILEKKLRWYSALTKGDTIVIKHADKQYNIDVIDVKPGSAISIIETDLNTEFVEPLDYKDTKIEEPEAETLVNKNESVFQPFKGKGYSLNGKIVNNDKAHYVKQKSNDLSSDCNKKAMELDVDSSDDESSDNISKKKFHVFGGTGWR